MRNKQTHLSIFGIGPVYGFLCILFTVIGVALAKTGILKGASISVLRVPMLVMGILLVMFAVFIFIMAQLNMRDSITKNQLVTSGIYACCRNPLYTSVMFICIGVDLLMNNLWLLLLPLIYWGLMTLLVKLTEEKWLLELYGQDYSEYCKRVNRCFPWFPARESKKSEYDSTIWKPILKCSICNGEQVAGFKNLETGYFEEVMLIKSSEDLEEFIKKYGIRSITKEY